jgi:tyrosyl-DNA phosphodiesterase 2
MESITKYLHDSSLYGSLLAGDLNAIEPFDTVFPSTYNFSDAYLALGGEEGMEKGFTWGYQSPAWLRDRYGCSRMDKVLYCGEVEVQGLEQVGVGIRIGDELWITDHYGLHARVEVIGGTGVLMGIRDS